MENDFIYHKKKGLPDSLCISLIDFFEKHPNKQKGYVYHGLNNLGIASSAKDSTDLTINFNKSNDSCIFNLHHYLCEEIHNYKEKYDFLKELEFWKLEERFNIRKYIKDQAFHKIHCEHGPGDCSTRILAWMVYLNDVKNGGETFFPYQKKKFKSRRGDILIWPAFWTHPHKGIPSNTETKYITTGWISFV